MPRGANPNSRKALEENRKKGAFTTETSLKAVQKREEKRAELKSFKEMDLEYTTPEERKEMLDKLKLMARRGNLKALEIYLKITGEDVHKVEVTGKVNNPFEGLTEEELRKLAGGDTG